MGKITVHSEVFKLMIEISENGYSLQELLKMVDIDDSMPYRRGDENQ